ncbi:GtrA family protein [Spirochaeta dissipatitropha]
MFRRTLHKVVRGRTHHPVLQFLRSIAASAAASATDFIVLVILVEAVGMPELCAGSLSMICGLACVYVIGRYWVFPAVPRGYRRIEFVVFLLISVIGLWLHLAVMAVLLEMNTVNYIAAKAAAMISVFSWNFIARRNLSSLILRRHHRNIVKTKVQQNRVEQQEII